MINQRGNTTDKEKAVQRAELLTEYILNMRLSQMKDNQIISSLTKLKIALDDFFSIVRVKKEVTSNE
jgi:hypothetical protein